MGDTPEDQPNNPYHPTPDQELNNYQESPVIDDIVESALFLGFYSPVRTSPSPSLQLNGSPTGVGYFQALSGR